MENVLYTFGYAGAAPTDLLAHVAALGAVVCDVRFNPTSRLPGWSGVRLRALLGPERYAHLRALGNANYRRDGRVALVDSVQGVAQVGALLAERPVILLCVCRDVAACHRLDAAEAVSAALGGEVVHLPSPELANRRSVRMASSQQPHEGSASCGPHR